MILFLLILLISGLLQLWLPWWSMLIVAALLSYLAGKSYTHAILSAFLACGIVWLGYALMISGSEGNLMTNRVAELLTLPSAWLLYTISFIFAAVTGAIGAWSGFAIKKFRQ